MGQKWCLSVSEEVDQRALIYTIDRNIQKFWKIYIFGYIIYNKNIYLDIPMTEVGKLLYAHPIKYYRATKTNEQTYFIHEVYKQWWVKKSQKQYTIYLIKTKWNYTMHSLGKHIYGIHFLKMQGNDKNQESDHLMNKVERMVLDRNSQITSIVLLMF